MSTVAIRGADLTFDPDTHKYRLPDGPVVPSVTQILSAVGVSTDFEELGNMSSRIGEAIDAKRQLGTALHADSHAFDDNDLDWATVHPDVEPYLRAWATCRANLRLTPLTRERRIFHPIYGYAGTLDGIFALPSDRQVLIDLATGDPFDAGKQYQTAAYLAAYQNEHNTVTPIERWAVQLTPERSVPYRIEKYSDWRDFAKFQSFVTTYNCQPERRRRPA